MIYITGDTHGHFSRFGHKQRARLPFKISADDYVIVCGDFGLLWADDRAFVYYSDILKNLPFAVLWVQGNHENYDMIENYPTEEWHGGKVRHIIRDKVILLERGQVFELEGKTFFTFGGASSHDMQAGCLDPEDADYPEKLKRARRSGLPFRIKGKTWWPQELPTEEEMEDGRQNLEKFSWKVDYVISHCGSDHLQNLLDVLVPSSSFFGSHYKKDVLTSYFEALEEKLNYKLWFCGHYHLNMKADEKHVILYEDIIPLVDVEHWYEGEEEEGE